MPHRESKAPSGEGIRVFNSVSFRLLAGLSIVALLSIASIVAAILTLRVTGESSDEIATHELPYLSAASQLSQTANLMATTAHALATSRTEYQLRAERNKADATLDSLDGFLDQMRLHDETTRLSAAFSGELFELVQRRRSELVANFNELNTAVAKRIYLQNSFTRKISDLRSTMTEVVEGTAPDGDHSEFWTRYLSELSGNVFLLPILSNGEQVRQTKTSVETILDSMSSELRQSDASGDSLPYLKWETLREHLLGDENIFDIRLDLIALERSIARTLSEGDFVSRRFVSAVSDLFFNVQAEFDQTNRRISIFVNRVSTTLAVAGGIVVVLIILLVSFIRYSVVARLTQLKNAIQNHFDGATSDIPTRGTDELADIGKALAYFVGEISEREERLVQSRHAAEAANAAKSEFLAIISHELRTPMFGVLAMARFLLKSGLTTEQLDYAKTIVRSGEDLLAILNDILDFSRIEEGKLDLDPSEFNMLCEIDTVESLISRSALTKGLDLKVEIAPDVPKWLVGDAGRLRQVLINLAGNAVKFTEKGEIRIEVSVTELPQSACTPDSCELHISVIDTGIGIAKNKLKTMFEPFTQADASTARQYGGSGLGLAISYRLVELMGGSIDVESEVGQGSSFNVKIPFVLVTSERIEELDARETVTEGTDSIRYRSPDPDAARESGAVILVAEDNSTNQKIIENLMSQLGYVCDIFDNGRDALDAYNTRRYGLILTDCRMPVMDGFELATRIREHERGQPVRTPIIALTADALQKTKEYCISVGMDETLTKPVGFDDLANAIKHWLPVADQIRTRIEGPGAIDDQHLVQAGRMKPLDVKLIREAFEGVDDEALAFLPNLLEAASPELRAIKEIIAGFTEEADQLVHPLSPTKEQGEGTNATEVIVPCKNTLSEATPPRSDGNVIDLGILRELYGDDAETFLAELLKDFESSNVETVREMEYALAGKDAVKLTEVAHKAAGSAAAIGARHMQMAAARLEKTARAEDWAAAESWLGVVRRDVQAIKTLWADLESVK